MKTKIKDLMTTEITCISPDASLQEAAQAMKDIDCGFLPVGTPEKIAGIITDRDIVIRALANGGDLAASKVREHMSTQVYASNEDDTLENAVEKMRTHAIGRLLVRDHHGTVTGILSFGGLLRRQASPAEISNIIKHTYSLDSIGVAV